MARPHKGGCSVAAAEQCMHAQLASSACSVCHGCLPQVLVKVMPMGLFRVYSAAIRGLNNIVGGISFVTIARMFGVQKSGNATPALVEA